MISKYLHVDVKQNCTIYESRSFDYKERRHTAEHCFKKKQNRDNSEKIGKNNNS